MSINYGVSPYKIKLRQNLPLYEFYDNQNRTIHNLQKAISEANIQYGNDWIEVTNGQDFCVNNNVGKTFVFSIS